MNYVDVLIPLLAGIYIFLFPDNLIKTRDATYEKKKSILKKAGIGLIAVGVLNVIVKVFGS